MKIRNIAIIGLLGLCFVSCKKNEVVNYWAFEVTDFKNRSVFDAEEYIFDETAKTVTFNEYQYSFPSDMTLPSLCEKYSFDGEIISGSAQEGYIEFSLAPHVESDEVSDVEQTVYSYFIQDMKFSDEEFELHGFKENKAHKKYTKLINRYETLINECKENSSDGKNADRIKEMIEIQEKLTGLYQGELCTVYDEYKIMSLNYEFQRLSKE